jgi:hypothetical protein
MDTAKRRALGAERTSLKLESKDWDFVRNTALRGASNDFQSFELSPRCYCSITLLKDPAKTRSFNFIPLRIAVSGKRLSITL